MPLVVGIDPGFKGAIAFLDPDTNELTLHDMPVAPNPKGKPELNLFVLGNLLTPPDTEGRIVSCIELVHTMPNQGISSAFRFGQGYGQIEMALTGHGWERLYVTPPVWKKHFKLSKDKGVSRSLASRLFPKNADQFARVKDDGRAEAALIALYTMQSDF